MIGTKVWVITDTQAGWDCVRGVFLSPEGVEQFFRERGFTGKDDPDPGAGTYIVHEENLRG